MKFANVVTEGTVIPQGLSFSWNRHPTSLVAFDAPDRMSYTFTIFLRFWESMARFQFRTTTRWTEPRGGA